MSGSRAREGTVARDDHAVVGIAGSKGYVARGRTNDRNLIRIVGRWVKVRGIAPRRFVGSERRHANAIVNVQLWRNLPRVLNESLIHLSRPACVRSRSDLGVAVGQTKSKIGNADTSGAVQAAAVVAEHEGPVLGVRAAGDG